MNSLSQEEIQQRLTNVSCETKQMCRKLKCVVHKFGQTTENAPSISSLDGVAGELLENAKTSSGWYI